MKTIATRFLTVALLAITLALDSGCSTPVADSSGAGPAVYSSGTLKAREYTPYNQGWNAALSAMNDLGYAVTEKRYDGVEAKITAREQGDKKITVDVIKVSGTLTEYRIQVGDWGDKGQSEQIYQAIKKRL